MAGGYRVPPDGDFGVLVQRLERAERRLAELERPTGSQTIESIRQLNNASETQSAGTGPLNQGNFTTPVSNINTPELEFVRPSWATRATVLASGTVYIAAALNGAFGPNSNIIIDGVSNLGGPATFAVPRKLTVVDGADMATGDFALLDTQTRSDSFARTFDFSGSTLRVSWRHTIPQTFGASSQFEANIAATVFWSAP